MSARSVHSYDPRVIVAHGDDCASVMLMNEAPGPDEAESGIPSFGRQGGNIFHALHKAGVAWATAYERFVWPTTAKASAVRHARKAAFLSTRARYLTCTNSYPQWPMPKAQGRAFVRPDAVDVLAIANLERIQTEIRPSHHVILVCGASAYLACFGEPLARPSAREGTQFESDELARINLRLHASFQFGWYLGHTRRWNTQEAAIHRSLRCVSMQAGWTGSSSTTFCTRPEADQRTRP